jgi:hypothetical protein
MEHPSLTVDAIWLSTSKRWLIITRIWVPGIAAPTTVLRDYAETTCEIDSTTGAMAGRAVRDTLISVLPY